GPDLPVPNDFKQKHLGGISPMGSAWIDADGDGQLDHWLAAHVSSPLWKAPDFQETIAPYVGVDSFIDDKGIPYAAWAMVVMDADLDGKADVFVTHDPLVSDANETLEDSRHAIFRQEAPGLMRDVGELAGFGPGSPCRGAFGSDIDNDGDTDLLVGCRGSVRAVRNDLITPGVGRSIILHGKVSNADGVHAFVTTPSGEKRVFTGSGQPFAGGLQRQSVRAPSGELTVLWPSGIVQKVDAGSAPVLHITEPAVFKVFPRRVAVGGNQTVNVEVDPAALEMPGASVVVSVTEAAWGKPLAKEADGIWRGTLIPPAAVSTVILTVTVGNQTMRIRPRVYVR
ncbi:MAG: VCBS repeat-containing protein, partial [Minicystis sp.]